MSDSAHAIDPSRADVARTAIFILIAVLRNVSEYRTWVETSKNRCI